MKLSTTVVSYIIKIDLFVEPEANTRLGYISESQRNLILQHHDSRVFQRSYLSRYITADTQAAYRDLKPQTALMRAASGMSRTIDRRRPRRLTAAHQALIDRHSEVKLLRRTKVKLKQFIRGTYGTIISMKGTPIHDQYKKACDNHRKNRRRHEKACLKDIKARFKMEQPVIDIQRQLEGLPPVEAEAALESGDFAFTERSRVIETLFTFATSSVRGEGERRADAIRAMTALCDLQEGRRPYFQARSTPKPEFNQDETSKAIVHKMSLSESIPIECKPTQCIFCIGSEGLPTEQRLKSFHSTGDLKRHFQRKHLRHHPKSQPIVCPHPRCKVSLQNTMHLQSHAELVHKTRT